VAAVAMSKFDANSEMPYEKLVKNLEVVKGRLNRPLTLSEKVTVPPHLIRGLPGFVDPDSVSHEQKEMNFSCNFF
jgi:hypothetical protein